MPDEQDAATDAVARAIPALLRASHVPAISLALVRDAALAWSAAYGEATVQPTQAATPQTIFQAASLSKPLFAYAVLGLVEQGTLDLDVPLTSYLPDPYVPYDPHLPAVTARHVLCHVTGWPNWRPEGGKLVRVRPPGTAFGYSGEGYLYLQAVVEHITGRPLDIYMREAVLSPLGMEASSYRWAAAGDPSLAGAHDRHGRPIEPYIGDRPEASSSLHSTPADYARFLCAMFGSDAGPGRPGALLLSEMLRPQIRPSSRVAWDLGWGLEDAGAGRAFWHWGDNPGYKSLVVAVPATQTGVVIMTNGDNGLAVCDHLVHMIIGGDHPALEWLAATFYDAPSLRET